MCAISNGYNSRYLDKTRGTNQGCPASPQIFCYCSEIMSHLLLQNSEFRGLSLHDIERVLSQFADDMSAYLEYSEICLNVFTNTMACNERQMGLKVSYKKTTVYRVGSIANMNAHIYMQREMKWSSMVIDTLGVYINCDGCDGSMNVKNYDDVLSKVHTFL